MSVTFSVGLTADEEERSPFREVATDIAFALHKMELEKDRKQVEEELKKSEEKLHLMFESVADGITVSNMDGKMVQVNEAMVHLHGYDSKQEFIGRTAGCLIKPFSIDELLRQVKQILGE